LLILEISVIWDGTLWNWRVAAYLLQKSTIRLSWRIPSCPGGCMSFQGKGLPASAQGLYETCRHHWEIFPETTAAIPFTPRVDSVRDILIHPIEFQATAEWRHLVAPGVSG